MTDARFRTILVILLKWLSWVLLVGGILFTFRAGMLLSAFVGYRPAGSTWSHLEDSVAIHPITEQNILEKKNTDSARIVQERQQALLADFLSRYNTPLTPPDYYAQKMVAIAHKYNLDYRLLPAIAMVESTLCKFIPADSYNCFGFGVYGGNVLRFDSFEHGFDVVAAGLKKNYIDRGLVTPAEIETRYNPNSQGAWSGKVQLIMEQIEPDTTADRYE